jgi:hypothetical protein
MRIVDEILPPCKRRVSHTSHERSIQLSDLKANREQHSFGARHYNGA